MKRNKKKLRRGLTINAAHSSATKEQSLHPKNGPVHTLLGAGFLNLDTTDISDQTGPAGGRLSCAL